MSWIIPKWLPLVFINRLGYDLSKSGATASALKMPAANCYLTTAVCKVYEAEFDCSWITKFISKRSAGVLTLTALGRPMK
jgi:hypothetical protein|tara:strand:- start:26 stop:265 length:240 start_codon:yes stop_codon:yes gene_type:complete